MPSPPPVLAPSPAKTIEKKPRLEPRATVRPEPALHEKAHSAPAKTPSRALVIGALLSAGLLVTCWPPRGFDRTMRRGRQRRRPRSRRRRAHSRVAEASRNTGRKARRNESGEPKSSEAPKTPVARQPDPATTARATGGVSKSALIVVDANVCKDLQVTGNWRCEPPSRPVAPGRLVSTHASSRRRMRRSCTGGIRATACARRWSSPFAPTRKRLPNVQPPDRQLRRVEG